MTDAPPPPALTEDQTSGRLFVRWNAAALVIGLVALVIGAVVVRGQRAGAGIAPATETPR